MESILYPFAFDPDGRLVSAHDAQKGVPYQCVGCKKEMIPKKGKIKRPHFAHKQAGICSDPDDSLHKMAQGLIVQSIKDAIKNDEKYRVGYICSTCREPVAYNVISTITSVQTEKSVVEGTRSDVVIYRENRSPIIIEVVVTHDLEPEAAALYLESNNPVFMVYPEWSSLDEFTAEVIANKGVNIDVEMCSKCKLKEKRRQEREKHNMELAMSNLGKMKVRHEAKKKMKTWITTRTGTPLYSHVRKQLYAQAIILMQMGFQQSKKNPSVFWFGLGFSSNSGCIYADLGWDYPGGNDSIWRQPRIMVNYSTEGLPDYFRSTLHDIIFSNFREAELAAEMSETGKRTEFSGDNAVGLVDSRKLDLLLADAKQNGHQDFL